jgi:hypothetical protein
MEIPPRPYFLPADLVWEELPENVRVALVTIVNPAYDELVIHAASILERSAGASLVFLLAEEVLQQFELGNSMFSGAGNTAARQQSMDRYLRLISAKQKIANYLERVKAVRNVAAKAA